MLPESFLIISGTSHRQYPEDPLQKFAFSHFCFYIHDPILKVKSLIIILLEGIKTFSKGCEARRDRLL